MKKKPHITIGITAFNEGPHLENALKSVLNQNCKDWEGVLILDGGYNKGTKLFFDKFNHHKFKKYNFPKNQGPALTRAKAIELCDTDWYYHLDGDDLLPEDSIKLIVKAINDNPKAQYIFGNCEHFSKNNSSIRKPIKDIEKLCFGPLFNATAPIKKDLFYDLGGYDSNENVQIHFDWDFWITVFEKKNIGFQINKTLYKRRNRLNNYGNLKIHEAQASIEYLINKHSKYFFNKIRRDKARYNVFEKLARHYKAQGKRNLAYHFAKKAIKIGTLHEGLINIFKENEMSFLRYKLRRLSRYVFICINKYL